MNQTEHVLLQAIQKSLWGSVVSFPVNTDWDAVLREAEKQTVLGIVTSIAPSDVQKEWKGKAGEGTAHFVRILHFQEQLCDLLNDNDIPIVVLKGAAAAIYYPNPSQRSMGDIDFLVSPEHFDQAKVLLEQNGYIIKDDSRIQRHIHVYKEGISFEQHRFFSHDGIEIEYYINNSIRQIEEGVVYGSRFPMLPKLANGLVLLGHLALHLRSGLGLRQVIDWMMYVNRELDDEFWHQSFESAAKDVGLDTAAIVTTRMCQIYLGLPEDIRWCESADCELCSDLMESILSSGNFGRKQGRGSSVETVTSSITSKGLFKYLQSAGEYNWNAYQKHKWLKPFAWLYQIGRYARQGFQAKRSGVQIKESIVRGKQRNHLLKQLKLDKL